MEARLSFDLFRSGSETKPSRAAARPQAAAWLAAASCRLTRRTCRNALQERGWVAQQERHQLKAPFGSGSKLAAAAAAGSEHPPSQSSAAETDTAVLPHRPNRAGKLSQPLHVPTWVGHGAWASPAGLGGHPTAHQPSPIRGDHAPVESGRCSCGFSGAAVACTLICRAPRCCWCLWGTA